MPLTLFFATVEFFATKPKEQIRYWWQRCCGQRGLPDNLIEKPPQRVAEFGEIIAPFFHIGNGQARLLFGEHEERLKHRRSILDVEQGRVSNLIPALAELARIDM